MADQNSADISYAYSIESALGVASAIFKSIEPNPGTVKAGANIKRVARTPIVPDRQERPGSIVDLDAPFEYESDAMYDTFEDMLEAAFCATFQRGITARPLAKWTTGASTLTAVTGTGYTVTANGDWPDGYIALARGFVNGANNGLKLLAGVSTTTSVKAAGLVAETTTVVQNASIEIAGVQCAATDINAVASGQKLTSTTTNFTTWPIRVGQYVYVGDALSGAAFAFNAANNNGFKRVLSIAATQLAFDRQDASITDETGTGKTIRVLFGAWLVPVSRLAAGIAIGGNFLKRTFTFESAYNDLGLYHYSKGQLLDQLVLTVPLTNKATVKYSLKGTDAPAPVSVGSRLAGASTPLSVVPNTLIASVADIPRLRLAQQNETLISADGAWFESVTMTIKNNAALKKYIGTLGPQRAALGRFGVSFAMSGVFTDAQLIAAIRSNTALGFSVCLRGSGDGGVMFDVPDMRVDGGDLTAPDNDIVTISSTGSPVKSLAAYPWVMSASMFPYLPI